MKKAALAALAVPACLALLVSLSSCGKPEGPAAPKAKGSPTVALVMKSLANEFFKTMEDGARAHQKQHAAEYTLIANGIKDEMDVAKQVELVELMIGQKVDAIVIAPANSKALISVCKEALDKGIVVVNIDNKFDEGTLQKEGARIPFVGPDNRKGARKAGAYLASKLKQGDAVAIVEGIRGAFNGDQRKLGFEDAMKAAGMKIVSSQSANWEMDQAVKIVSAILPPNPDLKAILCANDTMAQGAIAALESAGKLKQIQVVGFDNIAAIQKAIRDGSVLCTADQHGDQIAVYGIEYALEILKTKAAPADKETPVDLVTAESLK
jgi:ribose transport system substrate-binding protein